MRLLGVLLTLTLVACGTHGPQAEHDLRKDTLSSEHSVFVESLAPPCDTLRITQTDLWCFMPLHCQLRWPLVSPRDSQQVRSALADLYLPFDSLWVSTAQRGQHAIAIDSVTIQIGLYLYAGIMEEIEIEHTGRVRVGNWSGRDGTLSIDRRTGAHTYGLWQ